jgi:magnesium transporter
MKNSAVDFYLQKLKEDIKHKDIEPKIHHTDMANYLKNVKKIDENKFFEHLEILPTAKRAETFLKLPLPFQIDLIDKYDAMQLAEIVEVLKSDEAVDVFILIEKTDKDKSENLFSFLSEHREEEIEKLRSYDESQAGSLMQTELFKMNKRETVSDAITTLAELKSEGIGTIQSLFITDEHDKLLKTISMDDLILEKHESKFSDLIEKFPPPHLVTAHESKAYTIEMMKKYDLTVLPIVDRRGHLIGRITHDDLVDSMQDRATQQMYNLNKLHADEEIQEDFSTTSRTRAIWLTVNLVNAIIASLVIGLFEETLETIVALAVLMPIVANMAGTASVQTMTVVVRQMGLGQIDFQDIRPILIKELNMATLNGLLFGVMSAGTTQLWFGNHLISTAIGLSMFVSFVFAGVLGATVPMLLKKINLDPAVASSVLVITLVDIIGFFSFLWFSELIVL